MTTPNFQDWFVATPAIGDNSFRTANTQFVASAIASFGSVLLNTLTPNGVASTNDTSSLTSSYRNYLFTFENVCPSTDAVTFQMTVATSGSNFVSGGYVANVAGILGATLAIDTSTSVILLSATRATTAVTTSTLNGVSGFIYMQNPAGTNLNKQVNGDVSYQGPGAGLSTSTFGGVEISGTFNSSNAITGVNFSFSSGNIATGVIKIYGLR